jgi:hypothetical protein
MLDSQRLDMHQAGRAIDFMVRTLGSQPDHGKGDPIANYLAANAEMLGIQFIVWSGYKFNAGARADKRFGPYGGSNAHIDHPHVEITPEAGARTLTWYASRPDPSPPSGSGGGGASASGDGPSAPYEELGGPSPLVMIVVGVGAAGVLAGGSAWALR